MCSVMLRNSTAWSMSIESKIRTVSLQKIPEFLPLIHHHAWPFIDTNMRKSSSTIHENYSATIKSVTEAHPMIAHDYTEIRTIALTELSKKHEDEVQLVTEAIEVCIICAYRYIHVFISVYG
jgi:hypothetical protein